MLGSRTGSSSGQNVFPPIGMLLWINPDYSTTSHTNNVISSITDYTGSGVNYSYPMTLSGTNMPTLGPGLYVIGNGNKVLSLINNHSLQSTTNNVTLFDDNNSSITIGFIINFNSVLPASMTSILSFTNTTSLRPFDISIDNNRVYMGIYSIFGINNTNAITFAINTYYYFVLQLKYTAGVYDSVNSKIYVNGTSYAITQTSDSFDQFINSYLTIGATCDNSTGTYNYTPTNRAKFNGYIGDILVYKTLLDTSQVQHLNSYYAYKYANIISPLTYSGLKAWYDASDPFTLYSDIAGTTLQTSNDSVLGMWKDKSGNNVHVTATANDTTRPLTNVTNTTYKINGKNSVRFVNTSSTKLIGTISPNITSNTYTIFIVNKRNTIIANTSSVVLTNTSRATDWDNMDGGPVADESATGNTILSHYAYLYPNHPGNTISYIYCAKYNGSQDHDFLNGVIGSNVNSYGASKTAFLNTNKIIVGSRFISNTYTNFYDGNIGELIVYNTALTDTQRKNIEAYLSRKWNIYSTI